MSDDESHRGRKTKMATGNQSIGGLREHIARSIREVLSVLHAETLGMMRSIIHVGSSIVWFLVHRLWISYAVSLSL